MRPGKIGETITPSYEGTPKPNIVDILKMLPKTNCRECGYPTCLVFATLVAEGAKDVTNCPHLETSMAPEVSSG